MDRFAVPYEFLASRVSLDAISSQPFASRFSNFRPLTEFFDFRRISKPQNFGEVQSRVNYNLGYFSSNYAAIFLLLVLYCLLTNLLLLFLILFVLGGMWVINKLDGRGLTIGSHTIPTSQLYAVFIGVAIIVGLSASPFSTVLWLIGASGVTILGHASFLDKPIESAFAEEAV